jgi:hypothetical protein
MYPINFYINPAWRREGLAHSPLLFPFWGNPKNEKTPFFHELFERHSFDTNLYQIVEDPKTADMVFLPYSYSVTTKFAPELLPMCQKEATANNLPLLIDGSGDTDWQIDMPNTFVLRHGGYRFSKKPNDIQIPFFADDLLEAFCSNQLELRTRSEIPSVSFAGWASLSLKQEIRATLKELPDRVRGVFDSRYVAKKKGIFFRRSAVKALKNSELVKTNFLIRTSYSGHTDTAQKSPTELRREFIDNMLGSDYCLDVRGDANNSIRLFEILSLGRVPVIVDTERNLPFIDKIDYSAFSLIVDLRDMRRLPEIIANFNASISDEQFKEMQKKARETFLNYFRVDAMTKPLMDEIRAKISL